MADRGIVEANQPFSVTLPDGTPLNVSKGDRYYSDDQVVKGREALFSPLSVKATARPAGKVETATAAPGERRVVSRPSAPKSAGTKTAPATTPPAE